MKKYKLIIPLMVAIFWIGSCAKNDSIDPDFKLGEAFEIKVNHSVVNQNEDVKFRITKIVEDSRCPEEVMCVWEGQVRMEVEIEIDGSTYTKELIYYSSNPMEFGGYKFRVLSVLPGNQIDETIPIEDYVFSMLIEK